MYVVETRYMVTSDKPLGDYKYVAKGSHWNVFMAASPLDAKTFRVQKDAEIFMERVEEIYEPRVVEVEITFKTPQPPPGPDDCNCGCLALQYHDKTCPKWVMPF